MARARPSGSDRCRGEAPVYDPFVLRRLRIENLVLIREADLELAPGSSR